MPDSFSERRATGLVSEIVPSIKGILFGFILLVVACGLLYWNEGRVDASNIAKTATEIDSATVSTNSSLSGKLVSLTGIVNSDQTIGDNLFLKPNKFIAVEREVEMYSWTESSSTDENETTYTYSKSWEENPQYSSNFKHPEGHENPQKSLDNSTNKVTAATLGAYTFDPQSVTLPDSSQLPLSSQDVTLSANATLANNTYLFSGGGTFDNPKIGDLRISYQVLRPGFDGTLFGALNGRKIDPYFDQAGNHFYQLSLGTRAQAIATLHTQYATLLWILRLVGFVLMWIGLLLLFRPISLLMDFIPIFGSISRFLMAGIILFSAFVLSIVTIVASILLHNFIAFNIIHITIIVITVILLIKNKGAAIAPATVAGPTSLPTNPLENYVRDARARGMSNEQIRQELLSSGWPNDDITRILG